MLLPLHGLNQSCCVCVVQKLVKCLAHLRGLLWEHGIVWCELEAFSDCNMQAVFYWSCCCQTLLRIVHKSHNCYAGLVSLTLIDKPLYGPPHLHMQQPTRCHFIGDLSPQGNPVHYLSSVRSLYDWYWSHSGTTQQGNTVRAPLVVNTHGWIKVHHAWLVSEPAALRLWHAVLSCTVPCCAVLSVCTLLLNDMFHGRYLCCAVLVSPFLCCVACM